MVRVTILIWIMAWIFGKLTLFIFALVGGLLLYRIYLAVDMYTRRTTYADSSTSRNVLDPQ